jgi:hypothetical protein
MDTSTHLQNDSLAIILAATKSVARAHLSGYDAAGADTTHLRIQTIFDRLVHCIERNNASPLIRYVQDLARDRFFGGVELHEVQTAINMLEEAIWKDMMEEMPPRDFAKAVAQVSAILGMGKDALACSYVWLASRNQAPALDLDARSKGRESDTSIDV